MPQGEGLQIRFWGVRGTAAVPGSGTLQFGGNTSCVEVRAGGRLLVLDAGSGIRPLGAQLPDDDFDILLSHTHIDHIQGLPLFAPLYQQGRNIRLWAGHLKPEADIRGVLGRLMSAPLFPLSLDGLRADVEYRDFMAGETLMHEAWEKAGITVTSCALVHPDRATGYRITHAGRSVCYITDYEHRDEAAQQALKRFVQGTDCLIYDSTYTDENYGSHQGWGHSTWQEGVRLAEAADVGTLVLFHHDPDADDATLATRRARAAAARPGTLLASEGMQLYWDEGRIEILLLEENQDIDGVAMAERLAAIGLSLSEQRDVSHLLETILMEAKYIARADGGTLYFCNEQDGLDFAIVRNRKLNIAYGGSTGTPAPFAPLPLHENGKPNHRALAAYAVLNKQTVHVEDVYESQAFDFEGVKAFDAQHGYRTQSVLAIPLVNHKQEVLGCLQVINAHTSYGERAAFAPQVLRLVQSLASQAAILLDNKILIAGQKTLLESFIQMIAHAIDAKSPYTGAHCERVPTLTNMLAQAACEATSGPMADFALSEDERYELHIAGWMHDCGKIITPVHIMDKSTKLEKICDRIKLVEARVEVMKREARIACLEKGDLSPLPAQLSQLEEDLAFLKATNLGGEFMSDETIAKLERIGAQEWKPGCPLLTEDELYNMRVRRGTLTDEDRKIMNDHMVHTCAMLEALPFPKHLRRVPEYAGGHHERMDGKGYPKGLKAGEMSVPARMMAVADVFEALTAAERPYKPAKKLSESMRIIGQMKAQHHLDPVIVDFFITSGVYRQFAERYLPKELIDEVDEAALLAMQPPPL